MTDTSKNTVTTTDEQEVLLDAVASVLDGTGNAIFKSAEAVWKVIPQQVKDALLSLVGRIMEGKDNGDTAEKALGLLWWLVPTPARAIIEAAINAVRAILGSIAFLVSSVITPTIA